MLEFIKQPGVYEVVLFFSGIAAYRLLSLIMGITHMRKFYRETAMSAFKIVVTGYLMALTALEQKEKVMIQAEIDEKIIKNVLREDKKEIETWRDMSLEALYEFSPNVFKTIKDDFDEEGKI